MTANPAAMSLMASLVIEDGRRWGDIAEPWQWDLARWALDPESSPYRWESRPRAGSKSSDTAGSALSSMLTFLPPNSRLYAFAVDKDQARLIVDAAAGFVSRSPALSSAITVDNYKFSTRSGSTFEVMAASAASAYGIKPSFLVCDEFCMWENTKNAKGCWTAARSSMGKVPGAKLLVASTSGDPGHWSHRVYRNAVKSPSWTVQDVPGPLPWVTEVFLADERAQEAESVYRHLHLNEWCAPEDRLTNVDDVHTCVTLNGPQEPIPGQKYVIGVDLSMLKDRTAVSVMHAERSTDPDGPDVIQRFVLDRLEVWKPSKANPIDFEAVEAWIVHAAQQYRAHVYADPYQAAAMVQRIRARGVAIDIVNFTPQSNNRMAMALHTTIRDHRLAIPDDEELIDELVNMRMVQTSPNVFKLDHDPDKHNDRGTALSLALMTLATTAVGPPSIVFAGPAEGVAPDGSELMHPVGRFAMPQSDADFLERLGDGSW